MKNNNGLHNVTHRLTFLKGTRSMDYVVYAQKELVRYIIDKPKIFYMRLRKVYPNRKRNLRRAWKSLEWVYDEV